MKLYHNVQHRVGTKFCSCHKKNRVLRRCKEGLPPKICICFLLWNYTHNFDETWPQPSSPLMYQRLFMRLRDSRSKGVYGGLPPKRYLLLFFFSETTHNFDETWPQLLSPVMYQCLFMALKNIHRYLLFLHYIFCWSSMPTSGSLVILSRRSTRGIAPMFFSLLTHNVKINTAPDTFGITGPPRMMGPPPPPPPPPPVDEYWDGPGPGDRGRGPPPNMPQGHYMRGRGRGYRGRGRPWGNSQGSEAVSKLSLSLSLFLVQ